MSRELCVGYCVLSDRGLCDRHPNIEGIVSGLLCVVRESFVPQASKYRGNCGWVTVCCQIEFCATGIHMSRELWVGYCVVSDRGLCHRHPHIEGIVGGLLCVVRGNSKLLQLQRVGGIGKE
jgi:hypothetical protein